MSKEEMEPKLVQIMDVVTECEGLIYANMDGKVIVGQTLTEMDHAQIAKGCAEILKTTVGKSIGKGNLKELSLSFESGFGVIATDGKHLIIGILGMDGKNSIGLLSRQLKLLF